MSPSRILWRCVVLISLAVFLLFRFAVSSFAGEEGSKTRKLPNFVIIFADDLGYGDLSCYGHPTIKTPNLDRMAAEGIRFTQFYSAAPVCTPSRAALMTGRLPIRSGMCSSKRRVLFPNSGSGLPAEEITLAEGLKTKGYHTACIGKWHLGHLPDFLPTRNGFDYYFGIPYSNDMDYVGERGKARKNMKRPRYRKWNVPLMRNEKIIERPANQNTITKRYTAEAIKFIKKNASEPFFVYLPHNLPHVPLFRSEAFEGHSTRGLYGDVIEEIDEGVGQIMATLKDLKIDNNTFVFFTSDNGPWLPFNQHGGSAGLLRGGKGSTWEGGMREPGIGWWPGKIPAGIVTQELGATMDLYTTCLTLAGVEIPKDRIVDGIDLSPVLFKNEKSPRQTMYYYRGTKLFAVRKGWWKMHFETRPGYGSRTSQVHVDPILFHLGQDPSEKYNIAKNHPDIVEELKSIAEKHRSHVKHVPSRLEIPPKKSRKNTP